MKTYQAAFLPSVPRTFLPVIRAAFRAWEKSGKVRFLEGGHGPKITFRVGRLGNGKIGFVEKLAEFECYLVTLADDVTFSLHTGGWWSRLWATDGDFDLLSEVQHELGHILTGPGHNDEYDSIMQQDYKSLSTGPSKRDFARILPLVLAFMLVSCATKAQQQPTVIAIQHGKDFTTVVIPTPPPTNILTSIFGDSVLTTLSHLFGL